MKSRYNFLSLLLLFCASLMAQSQNVRVINSSNLENNKVIIVKDDYSLINNYNSSNPVVVRHLRDQRNPCQVFIGVGTIRHAESGGLTVDYTVDNTPATTYGILEGDIVVALDGVPVSTQFELETQRDKHQPGDAFTLDILRGGAKMTINARFKTCTEEEIKEAEAQKEEWEEHLNERMIQIQSMPHIAGALRNVEMKERPILGIYKDEAAVSADGIVIKEIIAGKGAEIAGLKAGDVIKIVDGKSMAGNEGLYNALVTHKPGDQVTVVYLREGQTVETTVTLSGDKNFMQYVREDRDPCKVFIGVYTTDFANQGSGVRVSGVLEGTPAKESAVQPGDVIIALDDLPVNTNTELRVERDKHQPGDPFTLTILRNGTQMDIDATFKACPKDKDATLAIPAEPIIPVKERENLQAPPTNGLDFGLQLEAFDAFPSPTLGPVNIRFEAKAVPTTVRITDVNGKTVYDNRLNQFSGSFNEQVNLEGKSPGVYTITVQQENKVFSKKIVLLSRV